jgi:hypothetical protein
LPFGARSEHEVFERFAELIERSGHYAEMYELQAANYR